MIKSRIAQFEPYFFYLIVILHLSPLFYGNSFPSFDGAAHVHNANVFHQLLFDENSFLKDYFKFNDLIVPNWTATALIGFLQIFFSSLFAEKIIVALYVILLPFAFRRLVSLVRAENLYLTYLIFPFIHSQFLFMGFHNFNIALVLLFLTLNFWIKNIERPVRWFKLLLLGLLLTATFFSHFFVFAVLLLSIALYTLFYFLFNEKYTDVKSALIEVLKKGGLVLIAASIPLLFSIHFLMNRPQALRTIFLSEKDLWAGLKEMKMLIGFNSEIESPFLMIVLAVIIFLSSIFFYFRLNQIEFPRFYKIKNVIRTSDVWLIISIIVMLAYFKLPDSDGRVGYISPRLALMFFLFLIIWLNLQSCSTRFKIIALSLTVFASLSLTKYYISAVKNYNSIANEVLEAENYIADGTTILPIHLSQDWFTPHFSNYLGYRKSCVILENYEANSSLFPIEWNQEKFANLTLDSLSNKVAKCASWNVNESNAIKKIDYIFIVGDTTLAAPECKTELQSLLNNSYRRIHSTGRTSLYQLSSK